MLRPRPARVGIRTADHPVHASWDRDTGRRPVAGDFMYDTYIIETRKGAAGIVVRDGHGFRFFAATQDF